jgi:hypothetical protein
MCIWWNISLNHLKGSKNLEMKLKNKKSIKILWSDRDSEYLTQDFQEYIKGNETLS